MLWYAAVATFDYDLYLFSRVVVLRATCCLCSPERRSLHTAAWHQLWWGVCAMCVVLEEKLTLFPHNSHNHILRATPHLTWTQDHTYELCAGLLLLVSCLPFTLHPCFTLHIPQTCCIQKVQRRPPNTKRVFFVSSPLLPTLFFPYFFQPHIFQPQIHNTPYTQPNHNNTYFPPFFHLPLYLNLSPLLRCAALRPPRLRRC